MEFREPIDEDWIDWVQHPKTMRLVEMLKVESAELMEAMKRQTTDERLIGASIGLDSIVEGILNLKQQVMEMKDSEKESG